MGSTEDAMDSHQSRRSPIFYPEFIDWSNLSGYFCRMNNASSVSGEGEAAQQRPESLRTESAKDGWTAFADSRRLLTGEPRWVAATVRQALVESPGARVLVFDDRTGETVDWEAGKESGVVAVSGEGGGEAGRGEAVVGVGVPRGPGRPRLGVVAREVTLLPRHWAWLAEQPGGASVALRKLVEHARRSGRDEDERRRAREAAYRFMATAAGDEPGFEEAIRALFRGRREGFEAAMAEWPTDVREHACRMAGASFGPLSGMSSGSTGSGMTP